MSLTSASSGDCPGFLFFADSPFPNAVTGSIAGEPDSPSKSYNLTYGSRILILVEVHVSVRVLYIYSRQDADDPRNAGYLQVDTCSAVRTYVSLGLIII